MVTFQVATLNVAGLPSPLAPLPDRATEFCRLIEASDIDVVNFQEVWTRRHLRVLTARLPSFPFVARRTGAAGQPAGGLATFSRVPVRSVAYTSFGFIWPRAGRPAFRLTRAVNSRLQGVLVVELALALSAAVVANVHLTANKDGDWSAGNRYHAFQRAQLDVLHRVLRRVRAAATGPVIVGGDLNVSSRSPLYPHITDGGAWHDPFAGTDAGTFHAELLPPDRRSSGRAARLDYLLVSPEPAVEASLLFAEPVALGFLSDHLGLLARILLER